MDWRIPRFSLANAAPENQECAHPAERVPFPILARERRTENKNGLAHSRFSLANAAPENQECAHPAERVPPPPPTGTKMDWRIPDSRSRTPHRRIKNAPIQLKAPPPTGTKMDWRIPDSRSRTPHRRILNAPIQLKGCPPPPTRTKMDWRIANAAPENWIGAFPILARERRTGESRMRSSN